MPQQFKCKACGALSSQHEGSEFGWCGECYADELAREAVWRGIATYDERGNILTKEQK